LPPLPEPQQPQTLSSVNYAIVFPFPLRLFFGSNFFPVDVIFYVFLRNFFVFFLCRFRSCFGGVFGGDFGRESGVFGGDFGGVGVFKA
jgi:hypothetical protein